LFSVLGVVLQTILEIYDQIKKIAIYIFPSSTIRKQTAQNKMSVIINISFILFCMLD